MKTERLGKFVVPRLSIVVREQKEL